MALDAHKSMHDESRKREILCTLLHSCYFCLACIARGIYVTVTRECGSNVPRSNRSRLTYANVCACSRKFAEYPAAVCRELVQTVCSRSVVGVRLLLSYLAIVFCCVPRKLETYIERACCILTHYARGVAFVTRNVVNTDRNFREWISRDWTARRTSLHRV